MLITPSRFPGDPLGYGGNQSGHFVMGMVVSIVVLISGIHWAWAAPISALAYLVLIEIIPGQVKIDWRDSFDDMAHAWAGAAAIPAVGYSFPAGEWSGNWAAPALIAVWIAYTAWQMWRRWR